MRASGIVHAGTLDTGNALRDRRVREAELLDARRHPEIRFASREIQRLSGGKLRIIGDLTIKGVSREVALCGQIRGAAYDRLELDVTGKLSRTAFGIDSIALTGAGVSDAVELVATLSLTRRPGTIAGAQDPCTDIPRATQPRGAKLKTPACAPPRDRPATPAHAHRAGA